MINMVGMRPKKLNQMIGELAKRAVPQQCDIYQVTSVDPETLTVSIKNMIFNQIFNDVPVAMTGAGNLRGIIKLPNEDDFVIAVTINNQKYVIAQLFDLFTSPPDQLPPIQAGEMAIINKEIGSYIKFNSDDDVEIKTTNATLIIKKDGDILVDADLIKFNNGTVEMARKGDSVTVSGTTDSGGSTPHTHTLTVSGTITTGNPKILSD